MDQKRRDQNRQPDVDRDEARKRSEKDDPTTITRRQRDDNQDDLGRDINDPRRVANDINEVGGGSGADR
jgi:hypothetical protein